MKLMRLFRYFILVSFNSTYYGELECSDPHKRTTCSQHALVGTLGTFGRARCCLRRSIYIHSPATLNMVATVPLPADV